MSVRNPSNIKPAAAELTKISRPTAVVAGKTKVFG